eukprot:scaffold312902_cov15-Prasinocladus_malaysianus.AAC.1
MQSSGFSGMKNVHDVQPDARLSINAPGEFEGDTKHIKREHSKRASMTPTGVTDFALTIKLKQVEMIDRIATDTENTHENIHDNIHYC